ncbi:DUF5777 family beta-barrel protein [Aureibacter tunicatorum]|uniref:A to I editase domain-containing protein n=1 Tax=Aureibacter tunicatorum TaxID=866807 RepID=A0AAE3XMW3_9BACT|nr:DUF5777 family beta-barrel protein [Aureibacter tunicatorum]MDR6240846.1 hypothetical protein [Aureibacter tunicatorum]BDD06821.1 hypothetical protein AUTU_43040 [Aureibacter tunicatorum]
MRRIIFTLLVVFSLGKAVAQENELLNQLETLTPQKKYSQPAFKAMKIVNLQSTKLAEKGDMYMYVSHRFGSVKDGLDTFFGLDNANTKIQLIYGLTKYLQLGLSRESLRKTYAGSMKFKIFSQQDGMPVNIAGYATINLNSELDKERFPSLKYEDRLSYATQLLISRKMTNALSIELAPTYVRQNLVHEPFQEHDQLALGMGGRIKVSKRVSFNLDYVYNFSRSELSVFKNPLSVGMDIETGGHVFQLLFTNAQSTNEPGFISNAEGNWAEGDVFFGFNIVRVF